MEAAAVAVAAQLSNTYYYIPPLAFLSRVSISLLPATRRQQQPQHHQLFRRRSSSSLTFPRSRSCCLASSPEALVAAANSAPGRGVASKRGGGDAEQTEEFGDLKSWMHENGLPPCRVVLKDRPSLDEKHCSIHYVAASEDLQAGDVAFSVPNSLVVTLDRVLGNETVAELLTTNKLSELACLALYLMYEKKQGNLSLRWNLRSCGQRLNWLT